MDGKRAAAARPRRRAEPVEREPRAELFRARGQHPHGIEGVDHGALAGARGRAGPLAVGRAASASISHSANAGRPPRRRHRDDERRRRTLGRRERPLDRPPVERAAEAEALGRRSAAPPPRRARGRAGAARARGGRPPRAQLDHGNAVQHHPAVGQGGGDPFRPRGRPVQAPRRRRDRRRQPPGRPPAPRRRRPAARPRGDGAPRGSTPRPPRPARPSPAASTSTRSARRDSASAAPTSGNSTATSDGAQPRQDVRRAQPCVQRLGGGAAGRSSASGDRDDDDRAGTVVAAGERRLRARVRRRTPAAAGR